VATFYHRKTYVILLTKNGLGYILGNFLTNASGHPAGKAAGHEKKIIVARNFVVRKSGLGVQELS
jgi:hypothetical protein